MDAAAQCQDPEITIEWSSPSSSQWETSILFSWKTVDCACLAAVTSLAWLRDLIFLLLRIRGSNRSWEEQTGCSPVLECVQPKFEGTSTIIMVCFCSLAGERGQGTRDYDCYIFSWKKKFPPIQFVCKGNEGCCRCRLSPSADSSASPRAVQGRGVSYIYIYISIYLYIYAFPSQSLISDSTSQLGCWCCRRIQNEGPFLMVLWLGLDQTCQHLFTEVRIPVASCPSPPGMGLFLCRQQLWLPACLDAVVWLP